MAVTTIAFSELDAWLQAQPANTVDTPYELNITGLTDNDLKDSYTSGTLGFILKQNSTKYVDLSKMLIPNTLRLLQESFAKCTSLVKAPRFEGGENVFYSLYTTFAKCTNLKEAYIPICNYTSNIDDIFFGCTSLETIYLDDSIKKNTDTGMGASMFEGCTNLKHFKTFLPSSSENIKTWLTNKKTFLKFPNEISECTFEALYPEEGYLTVSISDLNTVLTKLDANTASTPYKIKVTGLTTSNCGSSLSTGTFGNIIKTNNTKYVDISYTELPSNLTSLFQSFSSCKNIVSAPNIPNDVVDMGQTFSSCSNLLESPVIPQGVTSLERTFEGCTSLTVAPDIPSSVTNMFTTFLNCSTLTETPLIPSGLEFIGMCFSGCTSLVTAKFVDPSSTVYATVSTFDYIFTHCSALTTFLSDRPYETKTWLTTVKNRESGSLPNAVSSYTFELLNSPAEIPFSLLSNELGALSANTAQTPFNIKVTELTANDIGSSQTSGTLGYAIAQNNTKYVELDETELPSTITSLYQAFKNCTNMEKTPQLPNVGNGTIITTAEECFYGCTSLLANGLPTEWWIPNMKRCFYECSALNISISRLKAINLEYCFYKCTSLRNSPRELIGLPSVTDSESPLYGVEQSLSAVFSGCSALNLLPDKIENFSEVVSAANKNATEGCRSVTAWNFDVINSNISWFGYGLTNLTSLTIRGSGGKYEMAFCGCANISSIVCKIMNAENIIGMFTDCTGLTDASEIVINGSPNGSPSANATFTGCTSMANFPHLSEFVDYESCFEGCTGVTAMPARMTNHAEYKFTSLSPMTTADVDGMFTGAANFKKAFKGCTSLASIPVNIRIHDSDLTSCFEGCTGLVNVELNDSLLSGTFGMNDCTKMFYNCDNMESLTLDTQAFGNISYIAGSCGKLETLDITMTGVTDASYAFCGCVLNDIHFDIEGNNISCTEMFHSGIEGSNVNIRGRITGVRSLLRAFMEDGNLNRGINFENVTFTSKADGNGSVFLLFNYAWLSKPPRFVGFKSLERCFTNCYTVDLTGYQLPEGVENLNCCFEDAITLNTSPACVLPDSVKTMQNCFKGSVGLTTIPVIPEGVTNIESAFSTETSTSLTFQSITEVPNVPSTVTNAKNAFKGRSAITTVNSFCIPKENLDSENYQDMFSGCSALTAINVPESAPAESDEWHLVLLDFTATNVSGKIYDSLKNEVAVASTQITKGNLVLPFYTDELLFSTRLSVAELEVICDRLLEYKYTYTKKDVIPPDKQSFVLWAQDPENFITNINFSGSARAILNIVYPVGAVYTQYPKQKSPVELYPFFTWEVLDYGGAFFRSAGGNADGFDANVKAITAVSGSTITIVGHGASVGAIIYDFDNNESRIVTAVNGDVLTLDSQFTAMNLRNVLITQPESLPNIAGYVGYMLAEGTCNGPFYATSGGHGASGLAYGNFTGYAKQVRFEASRANQLFKDNAHVITENFTKIEWVRKE